MRAVRIHRAQAVFALVLLVLMAHGAFTSRGWTAIWQGALAVSALVVLGLWLLQRRT